jgi:hypothetical protein
MKVAQIRSNPIRISARFRLVHAFRDGPEYGRVEAAMCAYFVVNWKVIFHPGPGLIRTPAAGVRFAKAKCLRDMAPRYPSKFSLAFLQALRSPRWSVGGREGA